MATYELPDVEEWSEDIDIEELNVADRRFSLGSSTLAHGKLFVFVPKYSFLEVIIRPSHLAVQNFEAPAPIPTIVDLRDWWNDLQPEE